MPACPPGGSRATRNFWAAVSGLGGVCDGFVALASSGPAIADIAYTGSRSYPVPWSLVGGPSVALPVLASAGLPLGLQVMGDVGSDVRTVATASAIRDRLLAAAPLT